MKERILQILQDKHLTSAKLADMIQVQRSSISHILSGRNKPSMDFLQKVLNTYDDISGDWLITGKGSMYKSVNTPQKSTPAQTNGVQTKNPNGLFQQAPIEPKPLPQDQPQVQAQPESATTVQVVEKLVTQNKRIKRIIIYYSDNSYEELFPSKVPE